jgi:hypothetical protein
MSEMEKLWKGLSDLGQVRYSRERGEPDPTPAFPYEIAFTPAQWEEFQRRLLPLLKAGQAMYDRHADQASQVCWDAAKQAALGGQK